MCKSLSSISYVMYTLLLTCIIIIIRTPIYIYKAMWRIQMGLTTIFMLEYVFLKVLMYVVPFKRKRENVMKITFWFAIIKQHINSAIPVLFHYSLLFVYVSNTRWWGVHFCVIKNWDKLNRLIMRFFCWLVLTDTP